MYKPHALAAFTRFGAPSIVIDFGTAVTFDVVGAPGRYLGGVIAPGMMSMTENLAKRTALLPRNDLAEPDSVGRLPPTSPPPSPPPRP